MNRSRAAFLLAPILVAVWSSLAQAGAPPTADALLKPYAVSVGDMIALRIGQTLASLKALDAPMQVFFERDKKKITVIMYGARPTIEGAKGSLGDLMKAIASLDAQLTAQFGVKPSDEDYTLIYLNRTAGDKEVLRREGGKFVTPD